MCYTPVNSEYVLPKNEQLVMAASTELSSAVSREKRHDQLSFTSTQVGGAYYTYHIPHPRGPAETGN